MSKLFKVSAFACLFAGMTSLQAAVIPQTALTKSCKSLVNTKLRITQPPLQAHDENTYNRLTKAQERMADGKYDEAIEMFNKLLERVSDSKSVRNDFARASFNQMLAYVYAQKGESQKSYPYFKEALKFGENSLPHDSVQSLRENVAGFMFGEGDKKKAVALIEEWLQKSNVEKANIYYLLSAFYADPDVNRMKDAVCPAYLASKLAETPNKTYLQLLFVSHYELKDLNGSAAILKLLTENFPEEKRYWRQLSQIYYQLEKFKESLAVMEMFYIRGLFETEADYKFLSSLFSYEDIPFRAAKILEDGIDKGVVPAEADNWRAVARNYHASAELKDAIRAYGKTAELSADGNDYFKQAELYSDDEQWNSAIKAFDKAIAKGGLEEKIGRVYLRKGIAMVNAGSCNSALEVFDQASKYEKQRRSAGGWSEYAKERMRNKKC